MQQQTDALERNGNIAITGLISTSILGLIWYYWGGEFTNLHALYASLVLSFTLQLSIWFCNQKFDSFGKSLLTVLLSLVVISYVPYAQYLIGAWGLTLFIMLITTAWKRFTKLKISFFILGFLYALVIFGSTNMDIGDPFVNEHVRQLTFRADALFFAAMSTMFKNYGLLSTGLHGLPWVHYHNLSHAIYGMIAQIFSLEPYECYGYVTFIVFSPLLIISAISVVGEVLRENKNKWFLMNFIILGSALTQTFEWMYSNHFISESYLFGLILFMGALSVLFQVVKEKGLNWKNIFVLLIYFPVTALGKISAGAILCVMFGIGVYKKTSVTFKKRVLAIGLAGITGLIGYKIARIVPIAGRLEVSFHWKHFQHAVGPDFFPLFVLEMFPYFFLTLPAYFYLQRSKKLSTEMNTWFLMFFGAVGIGFIALNLTIDSSGWYFSGIHAWVALPLIAMLFNELSGTFKPNLLWQNMKSKNAEKVHFSIIVIFLATCIGYYYAIRFPQEFREIVQNKRVLLEHRNGENRFIRLFQEVRSDPDQKLMVYIPKTENDFWLTTDGLYGRDPRLWQTQCACIPLYVPILTGRPSLFGLPAPARQCAPFHRGYEVYSELDYARSGKKNYSHDELCTEAKKFGFHGYYRLTSKAEKKLCDEI